MHRLTLWVPGNPKKLMRVKQQNVESSLIAALYSAYTSYAVAVLFAIEIDKLVCRVVHIAHKTNWYRWLAGKDKFTILLYKKTTFRYFVTNYAIRNTIFQILTQHYAKQSLKELWDLKRISFFCRLVKTVVEAYCTHFDKFCSKITIEASIWAPTQLLIHSTERRRSEESRARHMCARCSRVRALQRPKCVSGRRPL